MTSVIFLSQAEEEMLEASEYYEGQTPSLGREFLDEIRRTVQRIAENPFSGGVVRRPIRR